MTDDDELALSAMLLMAAVHVYEYARQLMPYAGSKEMADALGLIATDWG